MTVDRRPTICFALPSLHGGGAERAAVQVLNALDGRSWNRTMYLARREGAYLNEVGPDIALSSGNGTSRAAQWRALRQYLSEERPDVVVSFLSYFTVLTAARAATKPPSVVFNQQTPMSAFLQDADYKWRRPAWRTMFTAATRAGFNRADLVIATSQGVREDLVENFGVHADRVVVIPNPVDLDHVRSRANEPVDERVIAPGGAPLVVAAGRLADAKNYPLMIEAMAALRGRSGARLLILGQGEREEQLRALVAERGLGDAVHFAGFQENPWKFIACAAAFLLTSRYEGFGNVLIEAMACGVPVVATASAGTRDIVRNEVDGILVEEHSPQAIAEALLRVLNNPSTRARMGAEARAGADRFAVARVAAQYDSTFRRLTA